MKVLSKFFRCSFVLMLALIVAVSAAIGVSADNIDSYYPFYALDQNNIHYIGIDESFTLPDNSLTQNGETLYNPGKVGLGIYNQLNKDYTYVYEIELQMNRLSGNSSISTELYNYDFYSDKITSLNNSKNSNIQITVTKQSPSIFVTVVFNTVDNNNIYGNDYFYFSLLENLQNSVSRFKFTNITVSSVYDSTLSEFDQIIGKMDEIIYNQDSNSEEIQEALTSIINNQIIQNNNWTTIINYGNNYNQIDSNLIGNLGNAEDQLSSAEDAIQNKSKSLIQRAASGIASAKTASQTLVSALSTTVPQIVSSTTDLVETAPEEVQAAVLSIPLLSFAAWLIGLKK